MPFIPAIGYALGVGSAATATAAATGTIAASIVGAGALGLGAFAAKSFISSIAPPQTPQQPFNRNVQAAKDLESAQSTASTDAADIIRRRRRAGTQTVFTDPLGVSDKATTSRKILLGE